MQYIICYGNPVDGFTFVGPFFDRDEAVDYAEKHDPIRVQEWWVADLEQPVEEEEEAP